MPPTDYRRRPKTPKAASKGSCGWVGFLTGLLMGVFISGLVFLTLQERGVIQVIHAPAEAGGKKGAEKKGDPEKKEPEKAAAPSPRYDFYTVLPETEVVVAEDAPGEAHAAPAPSAATATSTATATATATEAAKGDRYLVQVSSFRTMQDADRLKAKLTLLGFSVEIQKVELGDKGTVYRVNSGQLSKEEAQKVRGRLEKASIGGLVIRAK